MGWKHWYYTLPLRLRSLFHWRRVDRELDNEIEYHIERLIQQNIAHGASPEEARYAALRAMDGLTQNKERARETWKVSGVLGLVRDLRYALRILRKSPGFATVAILSLALGIGANSAIFSVVNAMLLRPLPFPAPDKLVRLWESKPRDGRHRNRVNAWNFLDWREHTRTFQDMAAVTSTDMNVTGQGEPFAVPGSSVSPGFFSILGIRPYLGRTFVPDDGVPGHDDKVVFSYGLWQSRFGGDHNIVGRSVIVGGRSCVIIGVMPAGFSFPESQSQLWTPLAITRAAEWGDGRSLTVVARLHPLVTLPQAQQDIEAAARFTAEVRPGNDHDWSAEAIPLLADVTHDLRRPLIVLLAAVGFLLLIACANVANLLLMRATGRLREMAMRQALGASRPRVIRQLLAESLVLALCGMAAGMAVARVGLWALLAMIPQGAPLPRSEPITIDSAVFAFTLAVSCATAILFGLVPALRLSRVPVQDALKQGTLQSTSGGNHGLRRAFAILEISLAILLSVGAGLMLRSLHLLLAVNPGFDARNLVTMTIFISPAKYSSDQKRSLYMDQLLTEVRHVPGVASAGTVHFAPLTGAESGSCFERGNQTPTPATSPSANFLIISPGYLATMKTQILSGRDFTERDQFGSPSVLLVNQAFVQEELHGENPVGQRLSVCWDPLPNPAEIVGVVADSRHRELDEAPEPTIYLANLQVPMYFAHFMVRAQGDPRQIMSSVEAAIHRVDPEQAVSGMQTMETVLDDSVSQPRFQALLLLVFAGLALVLSIIGVYGVIAYSVGQRTREIGIRVALGADRARVLSLVMQEVLLLTGVGLVLGLVSAFALTRLLASLLFEVTPTDPITLFLVSCLVMVATALAAYSPARRATKVDPMRALRYE
jgi:predicted permease